jgi:hypothetical protein
MLMKKVPTTLLDYHKFAKMIIVFPRKPLSSPPTFVKNVQANRWNPEDTWLPPEEDIVLGGYLVYRVEGKVTFARKEPAIRRLRPGRRLP